jgi:DNA-binding beta-propeller fold protein YncE
MRWFRLAVLVLPVLGFTLTAVRAQEARGSSLAKPPAVPVSTGQVITPTAAPGAIYSVLNPALPRTPRLPAGFAQSLVLSPDGKTLLVLTSGYNRRLDAKGAKIAAESTQFVFVFDVSTGRAVQTQVLQVSNSFVGIAFAPDGQHFYVPGAAEDNVHVFARQPGGRWAEAGPPIALGHAQGLGIKQKPLASGIAVTADGRRAVVVNRYNDSISVIDLAQRKLLAEQDLRPGKSGGTPGTSGGQFPNSVAIVGNHTAYVSSELDREVVVLDIAGDRPAVKARIPVAGNPNKLLLNRAQTQLFVAADNADAVTIISTVSNTVTAQVPTLAPASLLSPEQMRYKGASPDGLALSPDERTLYVTNRGSNALAVVSLAEPQPAVTGLIPTGWYPSDVRVSADGGMLYISNAKTMPGGNPGMCSGQARPTCRVPRSPLKAGPSHNQYIENLIGSALLSLPAPNDGQLAQLTRQVAANNGFGALPSAAEAQTMAALRANIKHVIYIVKENRTYDQVLGDLGQGNGDPRLTEFPDKTTPSQHALARQFVNLDNFLVPGDVSGNGWPWSTGARESDAGAKIVPPNYANNGGGGSYDWEGTNRGVAVGMPPAARVAADPDHAKLDIDTLPGHGDVAAPDGPGGVVQKGYLWSSALRAGLSVRGYGFFTIDTAAPAERAAFAKGVPQAAASNPELAALTDVYYRGFDMDYPEYYRLLEWEREFNGFVANGKLPSLSLVRMGNDHTGSFKTAMDGVNTPEIQLADNDYAVGRLVQAVANSRYAKDTLIFIVEDDAQDGPDHVDSHRSIAFVVGPYVKKNALISRRYTTVNLLRTITDVLGMDHLGLFDANQLPMAELFNMSPDNAAWQFQAVASGLLKSTALPLPADARFGLAAQPTRSAQYWVANTRRFDFSSEDRLDARAYNQVLWRGLMGSRPYPALRSVSSTKARRDDD